MSEAANGSRVSGWDIIQGIPALISSVAALSLIVSIAYQIGYLFAIDKTIVALFSIQDAVTGALNVVPFAAFGMGLRYCTMSITGEINHVYRRRLWSYWLALAFALLVIVLTPFRFLGICILSIVLLNWIDTERRGHGFSLTVLVMALLAAAFGWGGHWGTLEVHSAGKDFIVDGQPYQILTAGSEVIVVRDEPGHVVILPRGEVKKIERIVEPPGPWLDLRKYVGDQKDRAADPGWFR